MQSTNDGQYQVNVRKNVPVMDPLDAPSSFCASVMKSIIPNSSTAGPVLHTGTAKLILTA